MKKIAFAALLACACTTIVSEEVFQQGAHLGACGDDASADATVDSSDDVSAEAEAGDDVTAEAEASFDAGPDVATCDAATPTPPTGTSNAWVAVTLPSYATGDSCQSIVVDPVNPGTLVTACGNNDGRAIKWYRSTDYGATWALVYSGAMHGNPWGFTGDPNPSRDPCSALTIYSPAGYGSYGAWKSTDTGSTWTRLTGADTAFSPVNPYGATDLYELYVLPDNPPNHVLATYHYAFKNVSDGGIGESTDGGATWTIHNPAAGMGTSHYVMASGASTWMVIAQDNNGANGIWRTTTAGRVGGAVSPSAWTQVARNGDGGIGTNAEHAHGSFTPLSLGDAGWYAPAWRTIVRSPDQGATWSDLFPGDSWAHPPNPPFRGSQTTGLTATRSFAYSNYFLGSGGTDRGNARAAVANVNAASAWYQANVDAGAGSWFTSIPSGMNSHGANPLGMAATCAPGGACVVLQATDTGVYRMVE